MSTVYIPYSYKEKFRNVGGTTDHVLVTNSKKHVARAERQEKRQQQQQISCHGTAVTARREYLHHFSLLFFSFNYEYSFVVGGEKVCVHRSWRKARYCTLLNRISRCVLTVWKYRKTVKQSCEPLLGTRAITRRVKIQSNAGSRK